MKLLLVLSITAFAATSFAQNNPLKDPNICGRPECRESDKSGRKFSYHPGTQYNYKYSVNVSTLFQGTSKNESTLHIDALVHLEFISQCDGILTVTDIQLSENTSTYDPKDETDKVEDKESQENEWSEEDSSLHKNSNAFSEAINEHPLRFAFQDGVITELCPYEEEQSWTLNFKKGILSLLQNTMQRLDLDYDVEDEEDVRGKCKTAYRVLGTQGTSLIIEKSKEDLSTCKDHSKLHSILQSTPYNSKVNYPVKSLLKSSSSCELSIDHRIYKNIKCKESQAFKPFSSNSAGATTNIEQSLELIDEISKISEEQPEVERRTSLKFDFVSTPKPTSGELKTSRDLIKSLCKLSADDIQIDFSDLFTKFIHTLRILSYPALSVLYGHSGSLCVTGKKHILDALPNLGSSASVGLMKDIILKQGVPENTIKDWMLSISLIPRPDLNMIESVYGLLQNKMEPHIVLPTSALTYTFCKQNKECELEDSVSGILQILEERINELIKMEVKDEATEFQLLVAIKALSNIGLVSESFSETLRWIIESLEDNVAIRLAAIDVHRRLSCEEWRGYFENIFRNQSENVEVRIASYLQVMRCPNYLVIRKIKHSLEIEEVNQVGSFIWSHLRNLLKSSIPSRVEIQSLLSDKDLDKKFSSDIRKFSNNFEGSIFFDTYNAGANYESNVIFSPSSYVPKSAMLNLTVDLFGESINLLEVYGRMEGFEHYLESIFGPKGPLSSRKLQDKIPKMRWGRDASQNELLKSVIDNLPYKMENDFGSPKVSLGMKLFGNELKYTTFNGEEEIKAALRTLNPVDHLKHILSGKEIKYNKAAMFLDSSYVVPSGAGLPLILNAVGTASINIELKGSLNANNFLKTKIMDVTGSIKPSVAVDIVGTMMVDAFYASSAIKLKTSAYSSSALEGHIKVRGSKLISLKFGIPKKAIEIFGAKSELIVMEGSLEKRQAGINNTRVSQSVCSWPAVDKTVGLKLCADYYFMNVTEMANAPYFVLAGPSSFRFSLQKSDPTATTYLLEYKRNELPNSSYVSLTFDTPGSSIKRVMGANLTIDRETQNLTLLLQSTEGNVLAEGKYKNSDMQKYLQFELDVNNQKNFEAFVALNKEEIKHGFLYKPQFYLGVNNDRIADMQGTIKLVTKLDISQYDVDLKFKTKRLTSKLFGYISKTDASISSSLKLNYQFVNTREHVAIFDISLANRSTKNIFVIRGESKLETTAYPAYNFNSSITLQKSGGHFESKFELNASPHLRKNLPDDPEMLRMQMFLTYRSLTNGTSLKASASVKRPSTELDVKGQLSYDVNGYSTNAMLLARYAKGKDIVLTTYWHHPRQTLENIEGRLNITIPSFNPMILEGKLKEKNTGDFMVELYGTWFSGDRVDVKGLYQDRSTPKESTHHLKLIVRSPSFSEINANCFYYRSNIEFKLDIKADQNGEEYGLYLKHIHPSNYEITSAAKLRYKSQLYSMNTLVSLKEKREISVELHIDQIRDIHLSIWAHNKEQYKEAGFDLKWDANRDPNQKLAVTVYYANVKPYNYEGNFHISYPGRTIKGLFNFILEGGHFSTLTKLAWNPDDAFSIGLNIDFKNDEELVLLIQTQLFTPFEDWKKTTISGGFHHAGNMYHANSSVYWQHNQHISVDLFGDYMATSSILKCEFMGTLDSTVQDIPSIGISIKHGHNITKVESELKISYDPRQKIELTSSWEINEDMHIKNLTGIVTLVSPFKGFNKGLLVSKIYVTSLRDLRGVANLDLDHREFTASVEGHFQKLTRSKLVFNITTPIEKYKLITGSFGFSEDDRHLIAMVQYPLGKTGIEIRFFVQSFNDFFIKFDVATPIEFLQEILIVLMLKPEKADVRVGWNSLLAGFTGAWHYANITDFEYSYKIYTPIEDFEENGIVAKLIYKEGLDFEVSIKLADNRLGLLIDGKPKPKILNELGIKTQNIYNKKLRTDDGPYNLYGDKDDIENDDDAEEDNEDDPFRWTGHVAVDTLFYPTVTANVDIDQKGTVFDVVATLTLPTGKAELRDEFDFINAFTMKNRLSLSTPYEAYKLVTSNYDLKVTTQHQYLLALDLNVLNKTRWIKTGVMAHYSNRKNRNAENAYNVLFHIHTPFENFPKLDLKGALNKEEGAYRTNFSILTNKSDISFVGDLEQNIFSEFQQKQFNPQPYLQNSIQPSYLDVCAHIYIVDVAVPFYVAPLHIVASAGGTMDEGLLEAEITARLITPILVLPVSQITFKRDFTDKDNNRIEFLFKMPETEMSPFMLEAGWKYNSIKDLRLHGALKTPIRGLEKSECYAEINVANKNDAFGRINLILFPIAVMANGTLQDSDLKTAFTIDMDEKRNTMLFNGVVLKVSEGKQKIDGVLDVNDKKHNVTAILEIDNDLPSGLVLEVKGNGNTSPLSLQYQLQPHEEGFLITTTLKQGEKFAKLNAFTEVKNKFDWTLKLQLNTSHRLYKNFTIDAATKSDGSNKSVTIDAKTPFQRLEKIQFKSSLVDESPRRQAEAFYKLGDSGGFVGFDVNWVLLENMDVKLLGRYYKPQFNRTAELNVFYINSGKSFKAFKVGGDLGINNNWSVGSNLSLSRTDENKIEIEANVLLPRPNLESHTLTGKFFAIKNFTNIDYSAKYTTLISKRNYGSTGHLMYNNLSSLNIDFLVEWQKNRVRNYFDLQKIDDMNYALYKLFTPKFINEALIANLTYIKLSDYHNVTSELFYPGNRSVCFAKVNFKEFANLDGFVNASTPFKGLNYTGAEFRTKTDANVYDRFVKIFWPNNTAFLDSRCLTTYIEGSVIDRDTKGIIISEIPLANRHFAKIDYEYSKKQLNSKGLATVEYNKDKILEGKYNCRTDSRANFDADYIHVEVENNWVPVGADYTHGSEYVAPRDDSNTPLTVDFKTIRVYHLHNRSAFDVLGDMHIQTRETGQKIMLNAIHSNRTVTFTTNYDVLDREFKQNTRLELGPSAWIAYDIDLLNKTTDGTSEAQQIQINLSYPRRNFTALGSYNMSDYSLSSEMSLDWDKDQKLKTVQAKFDWKHDENSTNRQEVLLELQHPSFEKNITILGEYDKIGPKLAEVNFTVDYSTESDQTLKLRGIVENNSNKSTLNYTYGLWGSHPASNLQLDVRGGVNYRPRWFYSYHLVDYKRTYLPLQTGEATSRIDLDNKEIEFKRKTLHELSYLWSRYGGKFPLYTANVSAIHGKDINASGEFYLNFKEKLLQLELNMTTDGSQSAHMKGYIPDARSAYFDIWRVYDSDRISDVSYLLRMNHSRLIVASLNWRPKLKQDIRDTIRALSVGLYEYTIEQSEYLRQYIRSETAEAINDVWKDAKPLMQEFLNNVRDLKVIEEDLDELKTFLNASYQANEFYVRDVTSFLVYIVDELSIKSHIESLPAIFSEIWEVMGESGKKIQKGISWVIDKIKNYYKNAAEFINNLFQGDSFEHISEALKQLVEKYDNFIKDMHVAFIRYMEQLWKQTYKMLLDNWHKTLAAIEPTFIKFIHYVETIVWNASTEFLDFLYIRKAEIIENPYFSKISKFTHDFDRFYKDMTGNDTIGSINKYTKVGWNFLKEKYFKLVPFGRELQDIWNEIINEIYELRKIPTISFIIDKYNDLERKIEWFCEYFDLENRVHRLITLIHQKMSDMKVNALEAENRYREAKTKFIFEPSDGIMYLENKLPIPWHAFNETPVFSEIPEYRMINSLQEYFSFSMTFSSFYHDYKPFTDPADWLPPFKAQSMLIGNGNYITFDGKVYNFQGKCSYLLANDFLDGNFSVAVSYGKERESYELMLLVHDKMISIDVFNKVVKVDDEEGTRLPLQIENVYVYQESDIITVVGEMGFELRCNMKYHVCVFEVSGWYFAKTAGLWGTINNEPSDDLLTSNHIREKSENIEAFAKSWALEKGCSELENQAVIISNVTSEVQDLCESFFGSNVSPFITCFSRISIDPFYKMCLDSVDAEGACSSAVAYMQSCSYVNTPLRIPDACVKCSLLNGTVVPEGEFVYIENGTLLQTADVVFIVEAKECNKNLRTSKKIEEVVEQLEKELIAAGVKDNRYAVVIFGGSGVYDLPRSIVINSRVFTEHQLIPSYFDHIPTGNGSLDIFSAISYATKLIFRPGVSKSFILLPCTDCREANMKLDYPILQQLLLENEIAFHILMNEEFRFRKSRMNKIKVSYGIDRRLAYTKKDAEKLIGDGDLRKAVQLPKAALGYCLPLALETNGCVFSGKKIEMEKIKTARKIASIFAKRVAFSAASSTCKTCECTAHNSGISYMECFPCTYPTPVSIDYGFDEDEMLSVMQPNEEDLLDYSETFINNN